MGHAVTNVSTAALAVAIVIGGRGPAGFDAGRAAQNMMLAAWELGIGSVPATAYEHDVVRRLLGYPDDQRCEYLLSFGYPADPGDLTRPPQAGGRHDLETMVREERW